MRLTTLGTGTIALSPNRVRAGHLVECGGVRMLLDCGSGVAHRLAEQQIDWWSITHIAFTHFHADHITDLPTLVFAWKYARIPGRIEPLVIVGPPGTRALIERMAAAFGAWLIEPGFPLEIREIEEGAVAELPDGIRLSPLKVPHTPESVAYSVEDGSRRLVYTGDTGFDERLGEWAASCDVLLCECSLPESMAVPHHLTPQQCGVLASIAKPKLLALTHLYPPVEDVDIAAAVRERWDGPLSVAFDGWSVQL
jgi:ribonuclease BN (tRNA processing enzyme)